MKKMKIFATLVAFGFLLTACGNGTQEASSTASTDTQESTSVVAESTETKGDQEVVLHRSYAAPHGKNGFARVVVAMAGDKVVAATIDEFQYLDASSASGVPNSDKKLAEGVVEGKVLASKRINNDMYSKMMQEKGKATETIAQGYDKIAEYAKGKTIAELEAVAKVDEKKEEKVDSVSGATLADEKGYLQAIIDCAKDDTMADAKASVSSLDNLTLKFAYGAPHGEKSFGDAVVLTDGEKVLAVTIDEFQYMAGTGVPNSDEKEKMAKNFADPEKVLVSKRVNNEAYSKLMADKAKATKSLAENYAAIQEFCVGKTAAELEKVVADAPAGKPVDAVTGATLVDTAGYLQLVAQTLK